MECHFEVVGSPLMPPVHNVVQFVTNGPCVCLYAEFWHDWYQSVYQPSLFLAAPVMWRAYKGAVEQRMGPGFIYLISSMRVSCGKLCSEGFVVLTIM